MRDWVSAGLYVVMKVVMIAERASTVWTAVKAVLRREAAFGQYATEEEIMEGGNTCAICQVSVSLAVADYGPERLLGTFLFVFITLTHIYAPVRASLLELALQIYMLLQ